MISSSDKQLKIIYHIEFAKVQWMRYISHLDLMRLFTRVLRRAGFSLYMTKGFNPHPVVRIKRALKLGVAAKNQQAEFVLTETLNADDFKNRFIQQLPDGIEIEKVKVIR